MDKETNRVIKKYFDLVKEKYPDVERAYLFGSYVSGNYNEDSDIDLAIIFKDLDDSQRFDIQVQLMILAANIDTRIEPHPFSSSNFNSDNPFAYEIKNTGVLIS